MPVVVSLATMHYQTSGSQIMEDLLKIQQFHMHAMASAQALGQSYQQRIACTTQEYLRLVQRSEQRVSYNDKLTYAELYKCVERVQDSPALQDMMTQMAMFQQQAQMAQLAMFQQ